jgi:hypothetical protein
MIILGDRCPVECPRSARYSLVGGKTELNAARPQEPFQFLFIQAQRDKAEVHQIGLSVEKPAFFENLEAPVFIQATKC